MDALEHIIAFRNVIQEGRHMGYQYVYGASANTATDAP